MSSERYFYFSEICELWNLEEQLLNEFADFGLISFKQEDGERFCEENEIEKFQTVVRLYKDLHINKEGIDVIIRMKQEMLEMKKELDMFRSRVQQLEQLHHYYLSGGRKTDIHFTDFDDI